eukprot:jgi/Mesen1/3005/ME000177S02276
MSTLAAARADNFYYPPEWTPDKGGLNKFQGQHPLRERAKKIDQGILVIRFEMPFNVWCLGCQAMIGKGVRFNAEKKAVGNYFSTKIWSFKMKSACCQHEIEIQTDPKNCAYIVKEETYDAAEAETVLLPDQDDRQKLADPFYKLEHAGEDAARARQVAPRLTRLKDSTDARHADNYDRNRILRAQLRAQKRRVAEEEAEARRRGLGIRLLPESQEDAAAASRVDFHPKFRTNLLNKRAAISASSIFSGALPSGGRPSVAAPRAAAGVHRRERGKEGEKEENKKRERLSGGVGLRQVTGQKRKLEQDATRSCQVADHERKLELVAKRRRIDSAGALALVGGAMCVSSKTRDEQLARTKQSIFVKPTAIVAKSVV